MERWLLMLCRHLLNLHHILKHLPSLYLSFFLKYLSLYCFAGEIEFGIKYMVSWLLFHCTYLRLSLYLNQQDICSQQRLCFFFFHYPSTCLDNSPPFFCCLLSNVSYESTVKSNNLVSSVSISLSSCIYSTIKKKN